MINFLVWLITGEIIGGLVTLIMRRRRSLLPLNVVVGSVSALVAGYLLFTVDHVNTTSFSWPGLLVSMGGSIALLAIVNLFYKEHTEVEVNYKAT
ncbi:MAG: GlsB/YeaQ/YmgE family stress response membrane protein [Anaerolineales bacterium]|nr:GlsB/YeaQ/YmgE family stress response membrane protein [Anaerolineales bacterium]